MNGLADIPLIPTLDATSTETSPAHQSTASTNIIAPVDLSTLDVQLSAIEPHPRIHDPVRLYPDDSTKPNCSGVQLDLHYAGNRPSPDVSVFVAVVMNRSALPVTELLMRFAVNKVSSSDAYFPNILMIALCMYTSIRNCPRFTPHHYI